MRYITKCLEKNIHLGSFKDPCYYRNSNIGYYEI